MSGICRCRCSNNKLDFMNSKGKLVTLLEMEQSFSFEIVISVATTNAMLNLTGPIKNF